MTCFDAGSWSIDSLLQTAQRGAVEVSLTTNETRLLAYLHQVQRPVPRQEILQEVFGYAPTVRSRALDMTLARLRKKLADANPIHTKRGVGVWIEAVTPRSPVGVERPTFDSPFHARPVLQERIAKVFDEGWDVVTLVGSGGAGKTRLALAVADDVAGGAVVASCLQVTSPADLLQRIASAAEAVRGEVTAVQNALQARGGLLVLDEAEHATDVVKSVVDQLPGQRVLLTSREPLGLAQEALVEIGPLPEAEAVAFLQSRLRVTRWGSEARPEELARVVRSLGGLPLMLELVAGHSDGVTDLLDQIEVEGLPDDLETVLAERLGRSFASLSSNQQQVMASLARVDGPLREDEIGDWLGPQAVEEVRELARRSLLVRREGGWAMLTTVRAYVDTLQRTPDDGLAAWLARTLDHLHEQLYTHPRRMRRVWRRLGDTIVAGVARLPLEQRVLPRRQLFRIYDTLGPIDQRDAMLEAALRENPHHLAIQALNIIRGVPAPEAIASLSTQPDPLDRGLAIELLTYADPTFARQADPNSWRPTEGPAWLQLEAHVHLLQFLVFRDVRDPARLREHRTELEKLVPALDGFPMLAHLVRWPLALSLLHTGAPGAREQMQQAIELCERHHLTRAAMYARFRCSHLLGYTDLRAAAVSFEDTAVHWARAGASPAECLLHAGLHRYAAKDVALAIPLLARAFDHPNPQIADLARALHLACRYRQGEHEVEDQLAGLALQVRRPGATEAGEDVAILLRAEVDVRHGRWESLEPLLERTPHPQASRWEVHLLHSLQERVRSRTP